MADSKITLDRFYKEFLKFVRLEEKRWNVNEKRWDINEKRWNVNEKRWDINEKRWLANVKRLKKIENKFGELFDFLDKDVMTSKKKIKELEEVVFKVS